MVVLIQTGTAAEVFCDAELCEMGGSMQGIILVDPKCMKTYRPHPISNTALYDLTRGTISVISARVYQEGKDAA